MFLVVRMNYEERCWMKFQIPNHKYQRGVLLRDLTTFHTGGPAKYYIEIDGREELVEAVEWARKNNLSIFVLGGGSDILVSDKGIDGLVIRLVNKDIKFEDERVLAEAGAVWDEVVRQAVERGLQGIECLSAIPGTVGGAPVQNIGAYGQEFKDTFERLVAYDVKQRSFVEMKSGRCKFGYRDSIFKKERGRYIIYEVILKLVKGGEPKASYGSLIEYFEKKGIKKPSLVQVRNAVVDIRSQKLEDWNENGNAGSFFKNPEITIEEYEKLKRNFREIPGYVNGSLVKIPAGWLIERAGWKGKRYKSAAVSRKHALILISLGEKGRAQDVKRLAENIIEDINLKYGIRLVPEVGLIGF